MGIIYCFTNLINQKKYIGQTINPQQRYNAHMSAVNNIKSQEYDTPLHRAMRKYGTNNFSYEILASAEEIEALNILEDFYIKQLNTKTPNGYNVLDGGRNATKPMLQTTKDKLALSRGKLTEDEVKSLRIAYKNHESPSLIYQKLYKDRLNYNAFLNIWTGKRYKNILPEMIETGRHAKLSNEQRKQICQEYKQGNITYLQLAKKYGVAKSTIASIIKKNNV